VADAEKKEKKGKKAPAKAEGGLKTTPAREAQKCREQGCKRPYRAKGYCVTHYKLWRQGEHGKKQRYKICSKEGCRKPKGRWGLCVEHLKGSEEAAAAAPAAPAST
jgi:hypothetical protein